MNEWKYKEQVTISGLGREAVVFFFREYEEDWGYMGMRDYRTYEPTDNFCIEVVHYNSVGHAHSCDAGYTKNSFSSKDIDKDTANKIWYNLKKLNRNYTDLYTFMKENDLIAKEA